jgi:hypothetical protein
MQTVDIIAMKILTLAMWPDADAEAGIQLGLASDGDWLIRKYLNPTDEYHLSLLWALLT